MLGGISSGAAAIKHAKKRGARAGHAGKAAIGHGGEGRFNVAYHGQERSSGCLHVVAALFEALEEGRAREIGDDRRMWFAMMRFACLEADFFEDGRRGGTLPRIDENGEEE